MGVWLLTNFGVSIIYNLKLSHVNNPLVLIHNDDKDNTFNDIRATSLNHCFRIETCDKKLKNC
jgi:hypothetical protein